MLLRFQEKPVDLYVLLSYTVVCTTVLVFLGMGSLLGILLAVFAPGYALVAVLFPGSSGHPKPGIGWLERIALSVVLSLVTVPLLGYLTTFTPAGIRFLPTVTITSSFTIGMGLLAYRCRMRLPNEERLSLGISVSIPRLREYRPLDAILIVALVVSIVTALGTLALLATAPPSNVSFTEFYLLGPTGKASGYPNLLNVTETGLVLIGIANHEAATVSYVIQVDLVEVQAFQNATTGLNETIDLTRNTISRINVSLSDTQIWLQPYVFSINASGLWKLQFLLFKDPDLLIVYEQIQLMIRVS